MIQAVIKILRGKMDRRIGESSNAAFRHSLYFTVNNYRHDEMR